MAVIAVAVATGASEARGHLDGRSCDRGRGVFAFHYAPTLPPDLLRQLGRFEMVVTGDVLPPGQAAALRQRGTRLFFYEWLTGLYHRPGDPGGWAGFVVESRSRWLLNPGQAAPGPDHGGQAYYYDPAAPGLAEAWARRVATRLRLSGYDGVFLDLVGSLYVPSPWLEVYAARHPATPYDTALAGFIRALRQLEPDARIFTNQGYRLAHAYLPVTHYDLSESLMTSYAEGQTVEVVVGGTLQRRSETFYRPWEELRSLVAAIDADIARYNPAVRLFHLNYVNPAYRVAGRPRAAGGREVEVPVVEPLIDRPALHYAMAAARLWGHESVSAWEPVRLVADEVYHADLGKPLGLDGEERGGLLVRYYERGLVAVNPAPAVRTADLSSSFLPIDVVDLWDCYAKRPVGGLTISLAPTVSPVSGRMYPAGRVYLHRRRGG